MEPYSSPPAKLRGEPTEETKVREQAVEKLLKHGLIAPLAAAVRNHQRDDYFFA